MTVPEKLEIIPEGEYEVLIQAIEAKITKSERHAYFLCTTVIEDECPQKGRKLFAAYVRYIEGLPSHPGQLSTWTPRYALVRVKHKSIEGRTYMHVNIRTLI